MNEDSVHIWQFPKNTSISISPLFLDFINSKIIESQLSLNQVYSEMRLDMPFSSFKSCLKKSYPNYRPLDLILNLCKKFEISFYELEKNVLAYRTTKSRIIVSRPELPVTVSPIFNMLMAHLLGDGGLIRFKHKKSIYCAYTQYDSQFRKNFIFKAERVFGKFDFKIDYEKNRIKVFLPEVVTKILLCRYGLKEEDLLSDRGLIPLDLENTEKDSLLAILVAFIIDEGHVDSGQIVIGLKNHGLIKQLEKISNLLAYKNSVTLRNDKYGFVYILKEGVKKFWQDYLALCKRYPEIGLGYKGLKIQKFINRTEKIWKSQGQNVTRNKIVALLDKKNMAINEIADELLISRQGIKWQLKWLKDENIVSVKKGAKNMDIYCLEKAVKFKESPKGRSKQIGGTKRKILEMLAKGNFSTTKLSELIELQRASTMNLLKTMEADRQIKRIGREYSGARPAIIWAIQANR
ncbi:MAG: ArsR family transcriptional regulator [Candidatus Diapherotrites archaeon]